MDFLDNLTVGRLKEVLSYFPETGVFEWKGNHNGSRRAGKPIGRKLNSSGYMQVTVDGTRYKLHRLAWLYHFGEWPTGQIDHINGNRTDNRICNLRVVSNKENAENRHSPHRNNKSGYLGVSLKQYGTYQATIKVNGRRIFLGTFDNPEKASQAYWDAKQLHHIRPPSLIPAACEQFDAKGEE